MINTYYLSHGFFYKPLLSISHFPSLSLLLEVNLNLVSYRLCRTYLFFRLLSVALSVSLYLSLSLACLSDWI